MIGSRKNSVDKRNIYNKLFLLNVTRNCFFYTLTSCLNLFPSFVHFSLQIVNILKVLARKLQTDKLSIKIKWNALIFAWRGGGMELFSVSEKGLQVKKRIKKDASGYPALSFQVPSNTHAFWSSDKRQ